MDSCICSEGIRFLEAAQSPRAESRDEVLSGTGEVLSGLRLSPTAAKTLGESKRGQHLPVDRPVGADERHRVQVADQAVLGDGQVARPPVAARVERTRPAPHDQDGRRAPSASVLIGPWHEHELARRRRALEQLVRVTSLR
jgi:hypothetical protein